VTDDEVRLVVGWRKVFPQIGYGLQGINGMKVTSNTPPSDYSLFNSADDCLAPNIGLATFEESLLLNVLFQEHLLIHEAYFFNSTLLAEHLSGAKGRVSLFEESSRQGLIVPAFRDPHTTSLEEAYEVMRRDDVYGSAYVLLNPALQPWRDRIIAFVDEGLQKTKPFYWPTETKGYMGDGYRELIHELLQAEHPPAYVQHDPGRSQLFQRVWSQSEPWRFDGVEEAVRLTKAQGARGLQRTELFCAVGWSLGIPRDVKTVGVADILQRCTNAEQKLAMAIFLKWVTQCHHVNQARFFGTAINFPVYNLDQDFIIDSLLRSPLDAPPKHSEGFRCEVELPPLEALLQADPTELVAIRKDHGLGYLRALKRWQDDPSSAHEVEVRKSLDDYCEQVCRRYDMGLRHRLIAVASKSSGSPWPEVGKTVGSVVGAATGSPVGVFCLCASTIATVYRYFRRGAVARRLAPTSHELEVTLPSSLQN
jgi:hypothetical protein